MAPRVVVIMTAMWVAAGASGPTLVDEINARRENARRTAAAKDRKPVHKYSPDFPEWALASGLPAPALPRGCGRGDKTAPFLRPRDDGAQLKVPPCPTRGIVVRRDMGSLGVSSFQQVYGALLADALGPQFQYWDEWQMASGLLRPGLQHTPDDAAALLEEAETRGLPAFPVKPTFQSELEQHPWNMSDAQAQEWVLEARNEVCHGEKRSGLDLHVVRVQGNFQHASFFRRYRTFIHSCVLRSAEDFARTFYRPEVTDVALEQMRKRRGKEDDDDGDDRGGGGVQSHPAVLQPADVVVYLRLGDKAVAGDTLLTFDSGYYDAVLTRVRPKHASCWIVTNTIRDKRAVAMALKYECELQSSGNYYSDWAALYMAPKVLVMAASTFVWWQALVGACQEVHYPAVGFFHDKHNVCMRERKESSHFGQMRLPLLSPGDDGGGGGSSGSNAVVLKPGNGAGTDSSALRWDVETLRKKVWYHDVYSEHWFLSYAELAAEMKGLSCDSVLHQHVCEDTPKPQNYRESRYCYYRDGKLGAGGEGEANAKAAAKKAHRLGGYALKKWRARKAQ